MVASAAADGANKQAAEATARRIGGLLAVLGILSRTIGHELACERTPAEVPCIFSRILFQFLHLFISI